MSGNSFLNESEISILKKGSFNWHKDQDLDELFDHIISELNQENLENDDTYSEPILIDRHDRHEINQILNRYSENIENHLFEREIRFYKHSGMEFWVYLKGMVCKRTPDGSPEKVELTFCEISKYMLSKKALIDKNSELNRRIKELESFHVQLTHDLKEPLRTLSNYSQLLIEDYRDRLDEDGNDFLNKIQNTSKRMSLLINLITEKTGDDGLMSFEVVSCEDVLNEVISDVKLRLMEKGGKIELGELPYLKMSRMALYDILLNLICNSLKYSRRGVLPKINIDAVLDDEHWIFSVRDNGIGIDPDEIEKIFEPYFRSEKSKITEGLGMGLPQCKKLVELHHGNIWVESTPHEGSTFYFSISDHL